ncbi:hypothetical protein [Nocardioides sp. W7]|uniref:hypothetical protein n=1 Tax=Nocardioides sp. W7 TaxID=2931390 RepID=UPI001FD33C84|nr:hypothetical protein [Nocardioides sp. W7]
MVLALDELDETTRAYMRREFEAERDGSQPYVSDRLTPLGVDLWWTLMEDAIRAGDDESLYLSLANGHGMMRSSELYVRNGVTRSRVVNLGQACELLATSEFNTWYVRGLCARLLDENVEEVEVYRAAPAKWQPSGCARHEGRFLPVQDVYDGHRAAYWPQSNPHVFSVPFQAGCHHSVRRVAE